MKTKHKLIMINSYFEEYNVDKSNIPRPLPLTPRFDFNTFPERNFIPKFRFSRNQIIKLYQLFRMPPDWVFRSRHRCPGIVGFCIFLRRLSFPSTLHSISDFCGYGEQIISCVFNACINHIFDFMAECIHFDSNYITLARMVRCARSVFEKGAPLKGCWGFIDGTVRPVSRPIYDQEAIYNGHHRVHALKYQGVAMADGMIVSLAGPFVGRNHDMHMFHESKIVEHLNNLNYDGHAEALYIFGDMGYVSSNRVITPFEGLNLTRAQKKFNLEMSRCREVIEWSYKDVLQYFGFNRDKYNLKTGLSPVGMYYAVSVVLTNCHNCFYPNQTSQYFDCSPASIEEYLNQ